jgi:DNA primase
MKFDNSFAEQVKASVDIVRVVSDYVRLRKVGANYMGLCPFHSEKTPSFYVHPSRQLYHCFGCKAGGDVLKFVQSMERITFPESLRLLAEKHGIPLPKSDVRGELDPAAKERLALLEINQRAAQLFKNQLRTSPEGRQAQNYLKSRGLTEETIDRFEVGYALSASDTLLRRFSQEFSPDLLLKSGLVASNDDLRRYDRFRKRIIFPIANESGKVIAFGGRILGEGQPKYLNSPETPLYSKSRTLYALHQAREFVRQEDFAILVEGYMDCIALHQSGVRNVVASCGTSLTEQQAKLLSRFSERIVVNFDPDSAGAAAALRSLNIFLESGFTIRVLTLPGADDPDSFIRTKGVGEYRRLLERAPFYFDYLLGRTLSEHNIKNVEGKVAAVNMMLPYLVRISNRIEKLERIARVAEAFSLEESTLREELKRAADQHREKLAIGPVQLRTQLKPSEKHLLKAVLENGPIAAEVLEKLASSDDYVGLQSENIFREIVAIYQKEGTITLNALQERLGNETDRDFVNQALFGELDQEEALHCLEGIKRQRAEQEIVRLQKQIKEAEVSQNYELLASLHSKKTELKRMMAG